MGKKGKYVGAGEVAALFDAHPYITRYQLWHWKNGTLDRPPFAATEAQFWGVVLEHGIAEGFCRQHDKRLVDGGERFTVHPDIRGCAANLDYVISDAEGDSRYLLECKLYDFLTFRDTFLGGNPPLYLELQLQQQLLCKQLDKGFLAVLVGGNRLETYPRTFRPAVGERIRSAILAFWDSIDAGEEPEPEIERDAKAIAKLHRELDGSTLDWRGNNYLNSLCAEYKQLSEHYREADKLREQVKAKILMEIGKTSHITLDNFTISSTLVEGGHVEYDRSSYRQLTINER